MAIDRVLRPTAPVPTEPGAVLLETERLVIRRIAPTDAAGLVEMANHKEVVANLTDRWGYPFDLEKAEATMARWRDASAGTDPNYPRSLIICVKSTDDPAAEPRMIGSIGLQPGDDVEYRTWILGYIVGPSAAGKGYATEAVGAFSRWAFATWPQLERIEATTFGFNLASQKVLRKSGFQHEGARRNATEKDGKLADDVIFGLIRSDVEGSA